MSPIIRDWAANDSMEETRVVSLEERFLHDVMDRGDLHRPRFALAGVHDTTDDSDQDTFGPNSEDSPCGNGRGAYVAGVQQAAFAEVSEQARTRLLDTMEQVGSQPEVTVAAVDQQCSANRGEQSRAFWVRRARSLKALTSEQEKVRTQSRAA